MLNIQSLRVKNIIIFAFFLLGLSFPLLFMNCSLDEGNNTLRSSDTGGPGDPGDTSVYTENLPPDEFPDPDNPKTRGKIVWPHGINTVEWTATSKITNLDINIQNGQVSITHTKAGQWDPTTSVSSESVEDPVEGNAWIIVPLNGKGYAAPYDWIGKADPDHMLDVVNLDGLYQQLPIRANVSALARWEPLPGDKIGFMVSGLVKGDIKNVEERSKMIRVTLPDKNGKISTETCSLSDQTVENTTTSTQTTTTTPETTEDTDIPTCSETSCEAPNRISIIDDVVHENRSAFSKAIELNAESGSVEDDDERWEFMDKVVRTVQATDTGFGYTCINKDCENNISTSKIAYKCKENTETSTSVNETIITIDFFNSDGSTKWAPSDPEEDQPDGWIFLRPGAPEITSEGEGPCSSDRNTPDRQSTVVQQIAAKTDDLYKTSPDAFTQRVVECLKDIDDNWGRHLDDSGIVTKDIIAYRINEEEENPYSIKIIADVDTQNPTLTWSIQKNPNNNQCGQIGGTWSEIVGQCVIELEGHCTQEQRDSGSYGTINGECHPKCESFADSNVEGVSIATGDECDDTANYNILAIKNTYEEKLDGSKCCRRSDKRFCLNGYLLYGDNCYPTCKQAAKLAGYTNPSYYDTYDNSFASGFFFQSTENCEDYKGGEDWVDFTFYDPYRFQQSRNTQDVDICKTGSCPDDTGCCVKDNPNSTPTHAYDSNGWNQQDRERISADSSGGSNTSSTTTTTVDSSSGDECTIGTADTDCFARCSMSEAGEPTCENGSCVCP